MGLYLLPPPFPVEEHALIWPLESPVAHNSQDPFLTCWLSCRALRPDAQASFWGGMWHPSTSWRLVSFYQPQNWHLHLSDHRSANGRGEEERVIGVTTQGGSTYNRSLAQIRMSPVHEAGELGRFSDQARLDAVTDDYAVNSKWKDFIQRGHGLQWVHGTPVLIWNIFRAPQRHFDSFIINSAYLNSFPVCTGWLRCSYWSYPKH